MKRYTIEVTEEQLRLIANAVEDWHRFLVGQTAMWNATSMLDNSYELQNKMAELQQYVTPELYNKRKTYFASYP